MTDEDEASRVISNAGELKMRARLSNRHRIDEEKLTEMVRDYLEPSLVGFIEMQSFFFIATASDEGDCDANFRGQNTSSSGRLQPLLKIKDSKTIIFPDFAGNGFYNSLGNIHLNPHIGMLFVDFREQQRARVNGKAFVENLNADERAIWPDAQAMVRVEVEQAYRNCSARIPKMKKYENSNRVIRLRRG